MKSRRDYVAEIRAKYARLKRRAPYAQQADDRVHRVVEGFRYLKSLPAGHRFRDEYLKYSVIGYVSSLEGYLRLSAADWIDRGEPYIDNAARLDDVKIDLPSVVAICKEQITVGQYLAHLVTLNSLKDINEAFSKILGIDFLGELTKVDYFIAEDGSRKGLHSALFPGEHIPLMEELFRLRHVFVHELALQERVRVRHFEKCIGAAAGFYITCETLFEALRNPRQPNQALQITPVTRSEI